MIPVVAALAFTAGLLLVLWGAFPPRPSLGSLLREASERQVDTPQTALRSWRGRLAVWLMTKIEGDSVAETSTDLEVTGLELETYAIDKLNAAIGSGLIVTIIAFWRGWASSPAVVLLVFAIGMAGGYFLPGVELSRKATQRREEFSRALSAYVTLVAVCVAGGGGINTAMRDAARLGSSWSFRELSRSLEESNLHGESPWNGFDRLARRMDLDSLRELAGALALAGDSGARIVETLQARAEASRDKELSEALIEAEKRSERMNTPVGIMLFAWVLILGYPAIQGLIGA